MMGRNKRKMNSDVFDEDDSFKHRHTSLRVNLSYSTNLTDSGNGSLCKTQIGKNHKAMDETRTTGGHQYKFNNENLQTQSNTDKQAVSNNSAANCIKEGMQLKHVTVNLEDISTKVHTLDVNCRHLKDMILSKTKEIFDKSNELSVKTVNVLANVGDCFINDRRDSNTDKRSVVLDKEHNECFSNKTSMECEHVDCVRNYQDKDQYCNIVTTPTHCNTQKNFEKVLDKSRLTQKRLFTKKGKQNCKIIKDVILNKNIPIPSLRQADETTSPVLSSNNRKLLSLRRTQHKVQSQSQPENYNDTPSTVCSDINIGLPILCSTYIEDNAMTEAQNKFSCSETENINTSGNTHTTNKVISMEITKARGDIYMNENFVSLQNRNLNANSYIKNNKKMSEDQTLQKGKDTTMEKLENINIPVNRLIIQNNIACPDFLTRVETNRDLTNINTQETSTEKIFVTKTHDVHRYNDKTKKQTILSTLSPTDKNEIIRSSLNVNTSLDRATETSQLRNVHKSDNSKIIAINQSFEMITTNKKKSITSNNQYGSTNTSNHTSLQMNTSIDSLCKTSQRKRNHTYKQSSIQEKNDDNIMKNHFILDNQDLSTTKHKEANYIRSLEDISLIERLKNIFTKHQIYNNSPTIICNNNPKIPKPGSKEQIRNIKSTSITKSEYQSIKHTSNSRDSCSCIEGTPYPISRSVLLKSQLRKKQTLDSSILSYTNLDGITNKENSDKISSCVLHSKTVANDIHASNKTSKKIKNDIIISKDISNETELEVNGKNTIASQNAKFTPVKKRKKRLLPLHENSQLCSIALSEEDNYMPEKVTPIKKNKKLQKRCPKKKPANSKHGTNNIKLNTAKVKSYSSENCDLSTNEKRKNKKVKKPRKIVSKKIVINKFVNEDILSILNENTQKNKLIEDKDSLDDFATHQTIPIQWNKSRSKKIIIVTTGLSKGDKNLVKNIVKSLGTAEMELNVSRRTTHVVSTGVRTVNLLRGIIRGCWLITLEWVLKSLENNVWLNPEEFEMKHFSKAVLENRKDRLLFGPSYIPELFTTCGLIYIEDKTAMPRDILKELIKTAGGYITENLKLAKVVIGMNGLKETWVLDSITTGELQLIKTYQRK